MRLKTWFPTGLEQYFDAVISLIIRTRPDTLNEGDDANLTSIEAAKPPAKNVRFQTA